MEKANAYWLSAQLGTKNSDGRMNDTIADNYWNQLLCYHSIDSLDLRYRKKEVGNLKK